MRPGLKRMLVVAPYCLVLVSVVALAAFTPLLLIERVMWEAEVSGEAYGLGFAHAEQSFRRGELRLLELTKSGD